MPYWENVTRSFRIAWNYKYLWLIALFSGEAGGAGGNFNYTQGFSGSRSGNVSSQQLSDAWTATLNWLGSHAGLVAFLAIVYLLIAIAFFILGAICEGATVRATAEHDAERPFNLGWAWRSGLNTMWVIVRFRLILFVLYLPVLVALVGLVASIFAAVTGSNVAGGFLGLFGFLSLIAIPYAIYLYLLERLGSRAVILEQLMARAGIVRGHRLLFKRLGRTLLVWLLSIAVAFVVGLLLGCFLALISAPAILVGAFLYGQNSGAVVPFAIAGGLVLFVIALLIQSFLGAQSASYWTLAFRRLDLDYPPVPAYQYPAPPPPPAAPPAPAPAPPPQAPS